MQWLGKEESTVWLRSTDGRTDGRTERRTDGYTVPRTVDQTARMRDGLKNGRDGGLKDGQAYGRVSLRGYFSRIFQIRRKRSNLHLQTFLPFFVEKESVSLPLSNIVFSSFRSRTFKCCPVGQNGEKHRISSHPIIHCPTSSGVSEVSEQAKWVSAAEHASEASRGEQGNEWTMQANERTS